MNYVLLAKFLGIVPSFASRGLSRRLVCSASGDESMNSFGVSVQSVFTTAVLKDPNTAFNLQPLKAWPHYGYYEIMSGVRVVNPCEVHLCTTRNVMFKQAQTCSLCTAEKENVKSVTRFSLTHSTECHDYHHLNRLSSDRGSLTDFFTVCIHTAASRILGPLLAEIQTHISLYFKRCEFIFPNTCW